MSADFAKCPRCGQRHGVADLGAPDGSTRLLCAGCGREWSGSWDAFLDACEAEDEWNRRHCGVTFRRHVAAMAADERRKAAALRQGRWA